MTNMQLTDYKVLTFDCYGTLIDWESGIFNALKPLRAKVADEPGRDAALVIFAQYETAQEHATPDKLYPELLSAVHAQLRSHWDVDGNGEVFPIEEPTRVVVRLGPLLRFPRLPGVWSRVRGGSGASSAGKSLDIAGLERQRLETVICRRG